MARDRLSLHNELVSILGSKNVYFQPPSTLTMVYPCIIYKLDDIKTVNANDRMYLGSKRYLLTIVDRNPDTTIFEKILNLPFSSFESSFVKDNLNQYICSLYW